MTHQSAALRQGQAKAGLSASQEAFPLHILLSKELKEQRKHISTHERSAKERPRRMRQQAEGKMVSEGSERGGVGAGGGGGGGRGRGCIVNQAALPKVGTCKSGERKSGHSAK